MNSPLTVKKINSAFSALGIEEVLVRGENYFYFSGGNSKNWVKSCVFVEKLNDKDLTGWILAHEACEFSNRPTLFPHHEQFLKQI